MNKSCRRRNVAILIVLLCGGAALWLSALVHARSSPSQSAFPQYLVTDLGVLPGQTDSFAFDIDGSSTIVGGSGSRAFAYRNGFMRDLGNLTGGEFGHALARSSDGGFIVGESSSNTSTHAFVYRNGVMRDLDPEGGFSRARAVNAERQAVVGEWRPASASRTHAFLYDNASGTFTDLGALGDDHHSQANAINRLGEIVGFSGPSSIGGTITGPGHLVMWDSSGIHDLGTFGPYGAAGWAIHTSRRIIAGAYGADVDGRQTTRGFTYDLNDGTFTELPVPMGASSFALGIDVNSDVVGNFAAPGANTRAALWRAGTFHDLNDLIPVDSGWVLNNAWSISSGQIVGTGRNPAGELHAYLLTPTGGSAWNSRDVGPTGVTGSTQPFTGLGTFLVRGAGHDIWGTSDAFHFLHQPLSGDGSVTTRVMNLVRADLLGAPPDPFAKAGVMMRNGLGADAAHVILSIKPSGGIEFMQRGAAGDETRFIAGGMAPMPYWVRLLRTGATITGLVSPDGKNWTEVWSTTASMPDTIQTGLVVTSHDPQTLDAGRFEGPSVVPAPWTVDDVGAVSITGNTSFSRGTWFIHGSGRNIWDAADSFHFVHQPLLADGEITARVVKVENTHSKAKAGVMIRDGVAPDAAHVILNVKPDGDVEFMQRTTTGGLTTYLGGGTGSWVRLERRGSTVTASISSDGSTWTTVGSTSANFSGDAVGGLAVTGHITGLINRTVVDNVTVR